MHYTIQIPIFSSERSKIIKKNIIGSAAIKGLSILTSLMLIPLTVNLLNQEKYGIWMTIFTIVTWFNMLDLGLGNGFRNKFSEAIAQGEMKLAGEYLQTLYTITGIIALCFFLFFALINPLLNWNSILNLPINFDENINSIIWLVFTLFCLQLFLKNISTILLALQKTTYSNSIFLLANILVLCFVVILEKMNSISLFSISIAFMSAPIIIFILVSVFYFKGSLRSFRPKFILVIQKKYAQEIAGIGLKYFFIQITTIIMFSSSNIIITQLFGPSEVTPYNISFRLFSSVQAIFTIIITPFWSAFTYAHISGDFGWIKSSIRKLIYIWSIFSFFVFVLWVISPFIFKLWIGSDITIPFYLSLQFAIFTILTTWINLFVFFINGIGKIKLQLYIALLQSLLNIPLAIFITKSLEMNVIGIIIATNLNLLLSAILMPLQYRKIINNRAVGIWME